MSYVYDIIVSFSYLVTPPFRSTNSLLFEIRHATKLSKSKKKVFVDRIKFYWQTSVKFVGEYLLQKRFHHKVFIFFKWINIESFHAETFSIEKFGLPLEKNSQVLLSILQSCKRKLYCYFCSFPQVPKYFWKTKVLERIHQRCDDIKILINISSKL